MNQHPAGLPGAETLPLRRIFRQSGQEESSRSLPAEHHLDVWINGLRTLRLVCTPCCLEELVLGRLYTEGMIASPQEVISLALSPDGTQAQVTLRREALPESEPFAETVPTSGAGKLLHGRFAPDRPLKPLSPIPWQPEWIFAMADALDEGLPLYAATRAIHSCFLCREGQICCRQEDLGRHNAVDKVVGQALREGIDLGQTVLYTSGRVPTDMVTKVIRAGIPVLASKAAPTGRAVQLAREYGLTLLGIARRDQMDQYWPR